MTCFQDMAGIRNAIATSIPLVANAICYECHYPWKQRGPVKWLAQPAALRASLHQQNDSRHSIQRAELRFESKNSTRPNIRANSLRQRQDRILCANRDQAFSLAGDSEPVVNSSMPPT